MVVVAATAALAATEGSDLGPLFQWPPTPQRFSWLRVLPFLATLPAMVLLPVGIVRNALKPPLAVAAIVLFPIAAYGLSVMLVLEHSKAIPFCGSCHVMAPVVESLAGDTGLAASHFRRGAVSHDEACYVCHSGYGIWGTVDAKVAGVKHMWHTVTGRYDLPIQHQGPFDINSCLNCHARAQAFRAVEAHRDRDLQAALLSREMSCTGICHEAAHPESALTGGRPAS